MPIGYKVLYKCWDQSSWLDIVWRKSTPKQYTRILIEDASSERLLQLNGLLKIIQVLSPSDDRGHQLRCQEKVYSKLHDDTDRCTACQSRWQESVFSITFSEQGTGGCFTLTYSKQLVCSQTICLFKFVPMSFNGWTKTCYRVVQL